MAREVCDKLETSIDPTNMEEIPEFNHWPIGFETIANRLHKQFLREPDQVVLLVVHADLATAFGSPPLVADSVNISEDLSFKRIPILAFLECDSAGLFLDECLEWKSDRWEDIIAGSGGSVAIGTWPTPERERHSK